MIEGGGGGVQHGLGRLYPGGKLGHPALVVSLGEKHRRTGLQGGMARSIGPAGKRQTIRHLDHTAGMNEPDRKRLHAGAKPIEPRLLAHCGKAHLVDGRGVFFIWAHCHAFANTGSVRALGGSIFTKKKPSLGLGPPRALWPMRMAGMGIGRVVVVVIMMVIMPVVMCMIMIMIVVMVMPVIMVMVVLGLRLQPA